MLDKVIIIPTYNEKENIEKMIRKVFSLEETYHIFHIFLRPVRPGHRNLGKHGKCRQKTVPDYFHPVHFTFSRFPLWTTGIE